MRRMARFNKSYDKSRHLDRGLFLFGTFVNDKKQTFEVSVPYPNINLPREFPPIFRMPRDMPFVSLIDDVIDSCIENGSTQSPEWILFHAQVHLSRGSPRNAIRLIMNEAASRCSLFTGSYPSPTDINPTPTPITCLNSELTKALPSSNLLVVAKALETIDCSTQAAICHWYANNKDKAFKLIMSGNRWDSIEQWYKCIGSGWFSK